MAKRKVYKLKEESKGLILEHRGRLGLIVFNTSKTPAEELRYYHANGFAEHIDVEEVEDESTLPKKEKAPVVPINKEEDSDEDEEDEESDEDDNEEELDLGLNEDDESDEPEEEGKDAPEMETIFTIDDDEAPAAPAAPAVEAVEEKAPVVEDLGKLNVTELQARLEALGIPYGSKEKKASLISKLSK